MATLIRVDKNGTKYWEDDTCPKCGGSGRLPEYVGIYDGVCFKCSGSGKFHHTWKEYTPEHAAKLEKRRLDKLRAKAPAANAKLFKQYGFNESGEMWIALGDTFTIKEELKAAGAKFDYVFFWHFDHEPADIPCLKISIEDVADKNDLGVWQLHEYIWKYIEGLMKDNSDESEHESEYIGNVGDKYEGLVTLSKIGTYETHFTYRGELKSIYVFKDENSNILVWKTDCKGLETEKSYRIKGTIKEHSEYDGVKQTILTRCRILSEAEDT